MKILLAALTSSFMLAACTPRIEVAAPKGTDHYQYER